MWITDTHVAHHQPYIHRLVGTRGPQAPAIFRRSLFPTDANFKNGPTTTEASSIDSLLKVAHPPRLPRFALLRFVRRAAVPEIQSVKEREKVPESVPAGLRRPQ